MLLLGALALTSSLTAGWPSLATDADAKKIGAEDAAIVAGVSRPFVLPEVKGAVENATEWYGWLTRTRGVPVDHVTLLRDSEVTRESLKAAAEKARGQVGKGGTLWIVFIGHGAPAKSGDDGLLLGVDAQRTELSIAERGLSQRELLRAAQGQQRATVAVFDACFSGMASDGKTPLVPGSQATLPVRRESAPSGLLVLSSSEEVAGPLPGHDRPAFSYLLLGAVRGWADKDGDGTVTASDALAYTKQALTALVTDKNQVPSARGAPLDLVFTEGAKERGPDLIELVAEARNAPAVISAPPVHAVAPVGVMTPQAKRAAEDAFHNREIRLNVDRKWVRKDYPVPLSTRDLLSVGREHAPEAAKTVEELTERAAMQNNFLYTGAPALGGFVIGAGIGIAVGGFTADPENPERAYMLGGFIGSFAGATVGALAVTVPVMTYAQLQPDEIQTLQNAEAQLAKAANDAERKKLGLPP